MPDEEWKSVVKEAEVWINGGGMGRAWSTDTVNVNFVHVSFGSSSKAWREETTWEINVKTRE
jgi:hypothetical protein